MGTYGSPTHCLFSRGPVREKKSPQPQAGARDVQEYRVLVREVAARSTGTRQAHPSKLGRKHPPVGWGVRGQGEVAGWLTDGKLALRVLTSH